jgi:putative transposase
VDRRPCFFAEIDYIRYLQDLREIARREGCAVHAYVLMTNHVHLLRAPGAAGCVGRTMQAFGRRYVSYVNARCCRTGTIWEGHYKACLVGDDLYLLQCHRYIDLNPVRAKVVAGLVKPDFRPCSDSPGGATSRSAPVSHHSVQRVASLAAATPAPPRSYSIADFTGILGSGSPRPPGPQTTGSTAAASASMNPPGGIRPSHPFRVPLDERLFSNVVLKGDPAAPKNPLLLTRASNLAALVEYFELHPVPSNGGAARILCRELTATFLAEFRSH